MLTHHTTLKVRFSDLDPYNHVNHAVYFSYFEAARIEALESVGLGLGFLESEGYRIVVNDLAARFLRPVVAGEVADVVTDVVATRRATHEWRQELSVGDERAATLDLRAAMIGLDGKPCRIPEFFTSALAGATA